MKLTRETTPKARESSALPALKRNLRIAGDYDDLAIGEIADRAIAYVEGLARITVFNSTYKLYLDSLPECFSIPRPKLISVESILYQDESNVQQTWATTEYEVIVEREPGMVRLAYDKELPETISPAGVIVSYTAGYGSEWDQIPPGIQNAILLVTNVMYYNRASAPDMAAIKHAIDLVNAGDEFGQI